MRYLWVLVQEEGRDGTGLGLEGDRGVIPLTCVRGWFYSDPEVELLAGSVAFGFGMIHCDYLGG